MQITKYNLEQFIDSIEYIYAENTLTFYTNSGGYLIPFSVVQIELEPSILVTTSLVELDSLGISRDVIFRGVELCKILHGYS